MTRREEWMRVALDTVTKAARGDEDPAVVLDGLGALSIVEHLASEGIVASPSLYDAVRLDGAVTNAWQRGVALLRGTDASGTFATAAGMALGGRRATVFADGATFAGARAQLESIAGRHLPLVAFVATHNPAGAGRGDGTSHESIAAARDAGWLVLVACNLQEALDLGLIARRVAETVLAPVLVVVDGEQIARGLQSVALPTAERIRAWLGDAEQQVVAATAAQGMLFGERRRPVPRWLDLERPSLIGAELDGQAALNAAAGQRPFFTAVTADRLAAAVESWQQRTGRDCGSVVDYATADAQVVIVAQGAAVETAIAVALHLRTQKRKKVGVVGLRWLRPLDGARVAQRLSGKRQVWVLDRVDAPTSAEPPLMVEMRAIAQRASEVGHFGKELHPGYPAWSIKDQPRLDSVVYGLGGGLCAADLTALVEAEPAKRARPLVLGVDFGARGSIMPKRQALLDAVRRDHPGLTDFGVKAQGPVERVLAQGAVSVAIPSPPAGLTEEIAMVLSRATQGSVRGRVRKNLGVVAVMPAARTMLADPGDHFDTDVVLFPGHDRSVPADVTIVAGGAIVIDGPVEPGLLASTLPSALVARLGRGDLKAFVTESEAGETISHRTARWVGAAARVAAELSGTELGFRRISQAFRPVLDGLDEVEQNERLDGIHQGFERVARLELGGDFVAASVGEPPVPMAVRHLRERPGYEGGGFASLARFWGETGVLYGRSAVEGLTPEPYLAGGAVPALSSTFADRTVTRSDLPRFDPATCTGCGSCWVACPESAIGAVALGASAALEGGMAIVKERGDDAEGLRMLLSKIGKRAATSVKAAKEPITNLRDWLAEPVAALIEKLPEDRAAGARDAFERVAGAIGDLPVARTAPLYDGRAAGEGEMLALVVNPDSCKGCGICIAACETDALVAVPSTPAASAEAGAAWRLWEQLPDTSGATIVHAAEHPDVGPLAASMLSKSCLLALAGGDEMEPGSGARIALRQVLAVAEEQQQRRWQSLVADLHGLETRLREQLKGSLADALPTDDLDALSEGLGTSRGATVGIGELVARVARDADQEVDVDATARMIAAAKAMGEIADRIAAGPYGLGRARYGLVLTPEAAPGLGAFPFNPVRAPVVIEPASQAPGMARGVADAQLAAVLGDLAEIRLARLQLENPRAASLARAGLRSLSWERLSVAERQHCPPLILVGTDETFSDHQLRDLFESGLPVKVVVLADPGASLAAARPDAKGARIGSPLRAVAAALTTDGVFVAQSSIAHDAHLATALRGAFAWEGPALVRVIAPSPRRDGFPAEATVRVARAAVGARVAPLFVYDPAGPGIFGSRFSLAGNPASAEGLVPDASPAHWALLQHRFAAHFTPMGADDPGVAIEQWLGAEPTARGATPWVLGDGETRLAISPALAVAALGWSEGWRTLQEIAGEVTPFTDAVRVQVEAQVAAAHAEEVSSVRAQYEGRLAALHSEFQAEALERLKQRLMLLAGHRPN